MQLKWSNFFHRGIQRIATQSSTNTRWKRKQASRINISFLPNRVATQNSEIKFVAILYTYVPDKSPKYHTVGAVVIEF